MRICLSLKFKELCKLNGHFLVYVYLHLDSDKVSISDEYLLKAMWRLVTLSPASNTVNTQVLVIEFGLLVFTS